MMTVKTQMTAWLSGIVLVLFLAGPATAQSAIQGNVTHVRDGDTIEVGDVAIRLNGLHAPELGEQGGRQAKAFMEKLVSGRQVICELNGERSYDRLIGRCYLGGDDIAAALVSAGLGRDCPRYSGGRYRALEQPSAQRFRLPGYCTR
jgi:endonuclease YncB( thermonuclease family)